MITVPDPAALLATLRADGYAGLPDVDVRIGASVLDSAIADSVERFVAKGPIILSDGGPYRTPAGPVVDRLAGRLGCPVVQLGVGAVRADEETVERAVAEVGARRLLVSVGSGTLTDIAKVTAQRTGSRHSRSKPLAASTVSSPTAAYLSSPARNAPSNPGGPTFSSPTPTSSPRRRGN